MKTRFYKVFSMMLALLGMATFAHAAVNPDDLLPPEQAFVPTVEVTADGVKAHFKVADGYYLYQSKIAASSNGQSLNAPTFSAGKEKEDEFFGKQTVYYHNGTVAWQYSAAQPYQFTLSYQGCADVGVCYPPVETTFQIDGTGIYQSDAAQADNPAAAFVKKPQGAANSTDDQQVAPNSSAPANGEGSRFQVSRDTLWLNLFWFFVAGLGLSFTACMYPLLPIVSSIIVGDKNGSKQRAFVLSLVYVQGLALTYTLVGVLAGLTGALLTVWLQQAWVVLTAAGLMVVLALSMFGLFSIQLPSRVQSYFQNQSNQLSGGKVVSVFVMGMLSALIVGPCVAPPLAAALGYIGKTGDAMLGGAVLYAMAMGTGVPLIAIATFGGHIMPRAGGWMNGVKAAFGVILLGVAVYLATPFLPYALTVGLYTLLLIVPSVYMILKLNNLSGSLKSFSACLAALLAMGGVWFGVQSVRGEQTMLHSFLTLHPPANHAIQTQKFTDVAQLKQAMDAALKADPNTPILLDFYADWCVSCKEMEVKTFGQASVQAAVPMARLFQIDVTANSAEHQALLKEYGLFGPPGLFVLKADGSRSDALLGYAKADEFIAWYQARR